MKKNVSSLSSLQVCFYYVLKFWPFFSDLVKIVLTQYFHKSVDSVILHIHPLTGNKSVKPFQPPDKESFIHWLAIPIPFGLDQLLRHNTNRYWKYYFKFSRTGEYSIRIKECQDSFPAMLADNATIHYHQWSFF